MKSMCTCQQKGNMTQVKTGTKNDRKFAPLRLRLVWTKFYYARSVRLLSSHFAITAKVQKGQEKFFQSKEYFSLSSSISGSPSIIYSNHRQSIWRSLTLFQSGASVTHCGWKERKGASTAPVGKVSQCEHPYSPDKSEHCRHQTDLSRGKHAGLESDSLSYSLSKPGAALVRNKKIAHFLGACNVAPHLSAETEGSLGKHLP